MTAPPANDNIPGRSPRALFGRSSITLELSSPLPTLTAWLLTEAGVIVGIRCGEMVLRAESPIHQLCSVLKLSGWQDCSLQVRHGDRSPAAFVLSIHDAASFDLVRPAK